MKRFLLLFAALLAAISINAQTYVPLNIRIPDRVTIKSKEGIVVQSTTVNQDKSITVVLYNANHDKSDEVNTYTFNWYLSYKGKRVSDYFSGAIPCRRESSYTVSFWPGVVPNGYEKYITVQLGREKDRRDDD